MPRHFFLILATLMLVPAGVWRTSGAGRPIGQEQGPTERPFTIVAKKYSFAPPRIEVYEGDLVRIGLKTVDIDHSFTIDGYRISKRVTAGHPVTFGFRADHAGSFQIYCDLRIDDGCRQMKGELVVKPRR